ncbi:hypothetical protein [Streptomyces sp. cmx-4-9]|uniref:hypothetical protein n=1 Tax=Streptomyces sp. cmx-4-9 TaxID=2790941 RepID=UPI0039818D97
MTTQRTITVDQARQIVFDAYTTGLPQAAAAKLLTGQATQAWVTSEYAALRRRGIPAMSGQGSLFDPAAEN